MCSVFITRVKKKSFENERGIQRKSESHNADKAFSETYHVPIMSKTTLKVEDFSLLNLKRNVMPLFFLSLFLEMG